ncbi:MAG: hypothetical protein ABIP02_04630, partial [Arenimonas sp.]
MHQISRTPFFACFALLFVLTSCTTSPTAQQNEKREHIPVAVSSVLDGVPYRIDIPENWNGRLLMLLHGYEPKGVPRQEQWPQNEATPVFLARGYAVAASAYSTQGWSVAEAIPENERLRSFFTDTYGKPARTYVVGFSLGSHIALASMEQQGQKYDGALAFCGANMPAAEVFSDGIVTPLVAFDYFFPKNMPELLDPASPAMIDPSAIEAALKTDEAKAALLADRLEIPRPALAGALMLNYMILREAQHRAGGHPVDNRNTRYSGFGDDEAFNKGV